MSHSHRALTMLVAVALMCCGCATVKGKRGAPAKISDLHWIAPVPEYEEEASFRKVSLDINSDQESDVFSYYSAAEGDDDKLLVRKDIDLNFDGKVDVSQIWKEGQMTQEQIDADFDGRTDWIDFYEDGERVRAEWDTSFDGRPDLIRYYEGGKMSRMEMDTTGDHQVDYWEYYEAGVMQRSGKDLNADGKADK